ncbi:MAG TPA: hypothetical protein VJ716_04405 [Gaiellaceae bacterium]|nr:hypothetical protein [Gaiellaceae bacterium]
MRRVAWYGLVAAIAFAGAGCAAARVRVVSSRRTHHLPLLGAIVDPANRVGRGPFVLGGGWTGGGGSGLWGDGGSGPTGTSLGCLDDRHYSYAFGVENTSRAPVRLTAAIGPNPEPRVVDRVATQLRLSPRERRPSTIDNFGRPAGMDLVFHRWSAAPTRPVTIPPHRIATIQVNFLMHHCGALAHGRTIVVPGSLVLRYRRSGNSGRQMLKLPENRFVVVAAPQKRACAPVAGSGSLVTGDLGCAFARHAAPLCRPMHNEGWLGCTVAGRFWDCGRFAGPGYPLLETCYLPQEKSHWFSVVWIGRGLGIWGAIANRRWNLGWNRIDARPTTRGVCEDRPAGLGLVFESSALRILRGKAIARVAANARVRFVLRNYRGAGRYSAAGSAPHGGTAVEVLVQRHGVTSASYVATAGRLTVAHAANGVILGTVFASLRRADGTKRASLNGTWSCRIGTG